MIIIILKYQGGSAMSWNVVLNQYIEIKEKALSTGEDIWNYDCDKETCLDYWVRLIGSTEYKELISCLKSMSSKA